MILFGKPRDVEVMERGVDGWRVMGNDSKEIEFFGRSVGSGLDNLDEDRVVAVASAAEEGDEKFRECLTFDQREEANALNTQALIKIERNLITEDEVSFYTRSRDSDGPSLA